MKPFDFLPYAQAATTRANHHSGICVFLAKVAQCSDAANIERVTLDERAAILDRSGTLNTASKVTTIYRRAVAAWQQTITLNESNSVEADTQTVRNGMAHNGRAHIALVKLSLGADLQRKRNAPYIERRDEQRSHRAGFDPFEAIERAEIALLSSDIKEVAVGFTFLTGRRPIEVAKRKGFKVTGRYTIEFSAPAKKRGAKIQPFTIYCLTDSNRIIDAIARLSASSEIAELDALDTDSTVGNEAMGTKIHTPYARKTRSVFGRIIPPAPGKTQLTTSALRAASVVAAMTLFKAPGQSPSQFAEQVLGHSDASQSLSYEDFYAMGVDGQELPTGLWRDRVLEAQPEATSEKKSSVTVDALTREQLAAEIPGATQSDRIRTAIEAYKVTEKNMATIEQLKNRVAKLEKELAAKEAATETATVAATVAPSVPRTDGLIDYGAMDSGALKGHQGPGSSGEKLRRAYAAIENYNAGKEPADCYRMSAANLRKVSGVRHNSVVTWMAERESEIESYNALNGLTSAQHDRGKKPIEELITW